MLLITLAQSSSVLVSKVISCVSFTERTNIEVFVGVVMVVFVNIQFC